jgi:hypothetical protein
MDRLLGVILWKAERDEVVRKPAVRVKLAIDVD